MNPSREEALFALALEKPAEKRPAIQSARGLAHSKTWRTRQRPRAARSVEECGSPLPLFDGDVTRLIRQTSVNPRQALMRWTKARRRTAVTIPR